MAGDLSALLVTARPQFGCFTSTQAATHGFSRAALARGVERARWRRVGRSVYQFCSHGQSLLSASCAATLALGGAVSHTTAARIHGLRSERRRQLDTEREIHLSAPRSRPTATVAVGDFVVVRHSVRSLPASHLVDLGWGQATSIERTIVDIAGENPRPELARIIDDQILRSRRFLRSLEVVAGECRAQGKPGSARIAELLAERSEQPTESVLEDLFVKICRDLGLTPTRQFHRSWDPPASGFGTRGRVDFAFEAARLIVEIDGRAYHGQLAQMDLDRSRDRSAMLAGWRTVRFTARMLRTERERVSADLLLLLGC